MDEEEIKKELQPQGIIFVKIISIWYSLYVLTIKGQTILKKINIGYLKKETRPYISNPQIRINARNLDTLRIHVKVKLFVLDVVKNDTILMTAKTNQNAWIVKVTMLLYQETVQNGKLNNTLWPSNIQKRFHSQMLANVYNPLSTHQRIHMQL